MRGQQTQGIQATDSHQLSHHMVGWLCTENTPKAGLPIGLGSTLLGTYTYGLLPIENKCQGWIEAVKTFMCMLLSIGSIDEPITTKKFSPSLDT